MKTIKQNEQKSKPVNAVKLTGLLNSSNKTH